MAFGDMSPSSCSGLNHKQNITIQGIIPVEHSALSGVVRDSNGRLLDSHNSHAGAIAPPVDWRGLDLPGDSWRRAADPTGDAVSHFRDSGDRAAQSRLTPREHLGQAAAQTLGPPSPPKPCQPWALVTGSSTQNLAPTSAAALVVATAAEQAPWADHSQSLKAPEPHTCTMPIACYCKRLVINRPILCLLLASQYQ